MKYEVVKSCRIKGQTYKVGEHVEVDGFLEQELLGIGRIAPVEESEVTNRAVGVEGSEEKPKKRTRAKKAAPKAE